MRFGARRRSRWKDRSRSATSALARGGEIHFLCVKSVGKIHNLPLEARLISAASATPGLRDSTEAPVCSVLLGNTRIALVAWDVQTVQQTSTPRWWVLHRMCVRRVGHIHNLLLGAGRARIARVMLDGRGQMETPVSCVSSVLTSPCLGRLRALVAGLRNSMRFWVQRPTCALAALACG